MPQPLLTRPCRRSNAAPFRAYRSAGRVGSSFRGAPASRGLACRRRQRRRQRWRRLAQRLVWRRQSQQAGAPGEGPSGACAPRTHGAPLQMDLAGSLQDVARAPRPNRIAASSPGCNLALHEMSLDPRPGRLGVFCCVCRLQPARTVHCADAVGPVTVTTGICTCLASALQACGTKAAAHRVSSSRLKQDSTSRHEVILDVQCCWRCHENLRSGLCAPVLSGRA